MAQTWDWVEVGRPFAVGIRQSVRHRYGGFLASLSNEVVWQALTGLDSNKRSSRAFVNSGQCKPFIRKALVKGALTNLAVLRRLSSGWSRNGSE